MAQIPVFPLLPADLFRAQATDFNIEPTGLELLVAYDRVLRSASATGILDGYALAGPTALHGVYIVGTTMERIADELCVAPTPEAAGNRRPPDQIASFTAAALPGARVERVEGDPEAYTVHFAGTVGPVAMRLRVETAPLTFAPPRDARIATTAKEGYFQDVKMAWHGRVSKPIEFPTAYAEEILLRMITAIVSNKRPDKAARVDDLRIAFTSRPDDMIESFAGPVRDALINHLGASRPDSSERLGRLGGVLRSQVATYMRSDALPSYLRMKSAIVDWTAFEDAWHLALSRLTAPLPTDGR